jgi:beta-glucanase (GH16 family)
MKRHSLRISCSKLLCGIFLSSALAASITNARALQASLHDGGIIRFDELPHAVDYSIQWALSPGGPWNPFDGDYAALNSLAPGEASQQSVAVPLDEPAMFFRVRATLESVINALSPIEAENYDEMSGVLPGDGGTGRVVGYFDAGDWMKFENLDFGAGVRRLVMSVAKGSAGGSVELRLDSPTGTLIGTFIAQPTGSWDLYTEQEINIAETRGVHDLYLVGAGARGVANIDWFRFFPDAAPEPDYQLVWQDDFDGTALDTTKWSAVQHGFVDNGEIQFYTNRPENVRVADGYLWLTAIRETYTGTGPWMDGQQKTSEFTSGKVESLGKAEFRYGKIEARLRMPRNPGTWPAFWMLGRNLLEPGVGWPKCGEIDIMEHANIEDWVGAAIHTETYNHTIGTQKTGSTIVPGYDTDFQVYGVEWTPDKLAFSVNGAVYFTVTKSALGSSPSEWPFDQPFWLILNLAVGGAWGGNPTGGTYPSTMQVDWVRVYQDQAVQ